MEVVLVHNRAPTRALWSEHQVKSLADGGLTNIVPTN